MNAYPPYYPLNYQSQYQMQNQMSQQNANLNNGLIWVQGESAAKSYLVAPNSSVTLWDSEQPIIYLKSADASGMPSMKILDYTIRGNERSQNSILGEDGFATKEDISSIQEQINSLNSQIEALTSKRATASKKKEVVEND